MLVEGESVIQCAAHPGFSLTSRCGKSEKCEMVSPKKTAQVAIQVATSHQKTVHHQVRHQNTLKWPKNLIIYALCCSLEEENACWR